MKFKKGDIVQVLDDTISGIVKRISNDSIDIETADGFLLSFNEDELILDNGASKLSNPFSVSNTNEVIATKEQKHKRKQNKKKVKERYQPTFEVDLHINELVESTRGMTNYDMLNIQIDTAKRQLDFAIRKRMQKMVFIHGIGDGVLRTELEFLLNRYENLKFYDADYQKYGLGATEVYIYQNVKRN